jgi:thiamine-monophosphate kinase
MENKIPPRLGEFELIDWIRRQTGTSAQLLQGIGDDCAVQRQESGLELLTTTDLLIESIHFNSAWTTFYQLGRKAAAVNLSDIAAMGGQPETLFLAVGRPAALGDLELQELLSGFLFETRLQGAVLAGGDSCASPGPLFLSVTAQGRIAAGEAIYRQGASSGDAVYVSGTLGDSALALRELQAGRQPEGALAARFHTPTPRVDLGQELAQRRLATAMLDISDGLVGDLGHILHASTVGAELELDCLPLSQPFSRALRAEATLIDLALVGGEDYELVFTSPRLDLAEANEFPVKVTRVGTISPQPGLRIRRPDGCLYQCRQAAFDHYT